LAQLYEEQNNFSEAERLFQWGLGVTRKSLGPEHPDVASLMTEYAALQEKMAAMINEPPT
jgi:hypothetical protein